MDYYDYAIVTKCGMTLAVRKRREQAEGCFMHAAEKLLESFVDGLMLVGIDKDETETILAVRTRGMK